MDNCIFRSALNGFNRQDVTAYIERTQKDASERVAELEEQIDAMRKSEDGVRRMLDDCQFESDELRRQLAEQTTHHERVKAEMEAQLQEMRKEIATAHKEKETVAQLELDARKRAEALLAERSAQAEEILAQARGQAQALLTAANERAEQIINEASQRAEAIRAEVENHVKRTNTSVEELASSIETVVTHVSAELRKMDVAVAQLPINFNHLRDGLKEALEQSASL